MSYILEALRKSEQERNSEKVPDLATHHPHVHKQRKTHYLYWILAIAIVLSNGIYLVYKLNQNPQPDRPVSKAIIESAPVKKPEIDNMDSGEVEKVSDEVKKGSDLEEKKIINPQPEIESVIENPIVVTVEPKSNKTTDVLDSTTIPNISELSYDVQQQIPDMDYSTHVHVKKGGSFIIINGKTLGEGMNIDRDLKVLQILSDGIILEYKTIRFFVSSMTSWQRS